MLHTHTLTRRPKLYCMHAAVYGQGRQTERQLHVVLLHAYIQTHTDRQTEISYEDFLADP